MRFSIPGTVLCLALVVPAATQARARQEEPAPPAMEQDEHVPCRAELAQLRTELEKERARRASLEAHVVLLREELAKLQTESVRREEEWLDYNRLILSLAPERVAAQIEARSAEVVRQAREEARAAGREAEVMGPSDFAELARRAREEEVHRTLRALLVAERLEGVRILEAGVLQEGCTGPVVLRVFDERGRALGSLAADRLRLEGSSAGRTLTIVLEGGYQRRSGEKLPFEGTQEGEERGGIHRIVLASVDPRPWREAVPELFSTQAGEGPIDDGRWKLPLLRRRLNLLLAQDVSAGRYRLGALGGVQDGVLRDVELDELDETGKLERRLLADRMQLRLQGHGVLLELMDGVQIRGSRKLPFLDGRYRIYLPRAKHADWLRSPLPGLEAEPTPEEETGETEEAEEAVKPPPADGEEDESE